MTKIPASYHQERLWFIDNFEAFKLYAGSPVYHNMVLAFRVNGALDLSLLEKGFNALIHRHEALRTKILTIDDRPFQVIFDTNEVEWQQIERMEAERSASDDAVLDLAIRTSRKPFILSDELLVRGHAVQQNDLTKIVCFTFHHLIADRQSLRIFARDLSRYLTLDLNAHQLQYADFSEWQKNLPAAQLARQKRYWQKVFHNETEPLNLAFCKPRPQVHIFNEASTSFTLPAVMVRMVDDFARVNNVDAGDVLLSAFSFLLIKYSNQNEINIGTIFSSRQSHGLMDTFGPIDNLAALRITISGHATFLDYVKACQGIRHSAQEHSLIPFDYLTSELKLRKDMSRTVLFDVIYCYEEEEERAIEFGAAMLEPLSVNLGLGKYDINLLLKRKADLIDGLVLFNADYYRQADVDLLLANYVAILDQCLATPEIPMKEISMLSQKERSLLYETSQRPLPVHEGRIEHLFEKHAMQHPDAIALSFNDRHFSYSFLNDLSDSIVQQLEEHPEFKAGDHIAIFLQNSELTIASIFAILKSGCVYVPVDPSVPKERFHYIVSDSQCKIVLTDRDFDVSEYSQLNKITPLSSGSVKRLANKTKQEQHLHSEDAYIIYTSGTTGFPKGCVISHQSVLNLIQNSAPLFHFSKNEIWIMSHIVSFDFSVWEIFGCLLHGGKLIIPDRDNVQDTYQFKKKIEAEKITVLNQTPHAFYNLTDIETSGHRHALASHLKFVIFGGEKLDFSLLKKWVEYYPLTQVKLINMYGITETTVHTTFHEITESQLSQPFSVIGKSLPGVQVYICDNGMQLLPRGIKGEILVAGISLSKGYLNKIDLTAEKFVQLPYGRVYRSGDIGMWDSTGNLMYFGRNDSQIKIRGFRIEIEEIRKNLLRHELVKEVIITVIEPDKNQKQIVAYVQGSSKLNQQELREFLKQHIPNYMLPHLFVFVDSFRLTENGKIDYKALPSPVSSDAPPETAATNEFEATLLDVVAKVLKRTNVKLADDFFLIGGDSVVAIQIISKLYNLGLKLEIKDIFNSPVLSELSKALKPVTNIQSGPESGEVILTPIQSRFFKSRHKEINFYNQGVIIESEKEVDSRWVKDIFLEILAHHDMLRARFSDPGNGGLPVQNIDGPEIELQYEFLDLTLRTDVQYGPDLLEKIHRKIDIAKAPYTICHLRRGTGDAIVIVLHHLVVDAVSWKILIEDFTKLFQDKLNNSRLNLPPKTTSYRSWAAYLNKLSQTSLANELAFIDECRTKNELPRLSCSSALSNLEDSNLQFDVEETERLAAANKRYNSNVQDLLLTALTAALHDMYQVANLVIAVESYGRDRFAAEIDLTRTVGWFTTIYPVLLTAEYRTDYRRLIVETKERVRRSMANAHKLNIALYGQPDNFTEVTSVLFNYLGNWGTSDNGGFFKMLPLSNTVSKANQSEFPLTWNAWITDGSLQIQIISDHNFLNRANRNILAETFRTHINAVVTHCLSGNDTEFTPSDFGYKKLSVDDLNAIFD